MVPQEVQKGLLEKAPQEAGVDVGGQLGRSCQMWCVDRNGTSGCGVENSLHV